MAFQGRVGNMAGGTGGVITHYDNYVSHTFLSSGTFTANAELSCDILIVAGGGGGGNHASGSGGGAGGMVVHSGHSISSGSYTVTVGGGGTGGTISGSTPGTSGSNSLIASAGTTTAVGGGGGNYSVAGEGGGSGAGGGGAGDGMAGGAGTSGQGNAGGSSYAGSVHSGGGGGGAGAVGGNAAETVGGVGGVGSQNAFRTGNNQYYAGGGGAGHHGGYPSPASGTGGAGGTGGGGKGSDYDVVTIGGTGGTANTGGGAGGAGGKNGINASFGGDGGSGIVVVRYKIDDAEKNWNTRKIGDSLKIDSGNPAVPSYVGLAGTFGKDTISQPIYISRWLTGIEYGNIDRPWTVDDTTGEGGTNNFPWYLQYGSAGWSSGRGILTMAKCRWVVYYFESDASGGGSGNFSGMGNKTFYNDAFVSTNKTFANAESAQEGNDFYGEGGYSIAGNYNGRYAADTANGRFFGGFNEQNDLGNPFGYCNMWVEIWCCDPTAKLIENHDITL